MDQEPLPPQPEVAPLPPASRNSKIFLILAILVLLMAFGVGGIFLGKSLNNSPKSTQPTVSPIPTQIPILTPEEIADLQRKTDLNIIRPALEMFRADQNRYPSTLKELVPKYLVVMPIDPGTGSEYYYQASLTKLDYSLSAKLSDGTTYAVSAPK